MGIWLRAFFKNSHSHRDEFRYDHRPKMEVHSYYVRAFLIGMESVLYSHRLGSWCTETEKSKLEKICRGSSPEALKILARIQRRRKVTFFRVSELILKYQKDLGHGKDVWDVIRELEESKLICLLLPPDSQTKERVIPVDHRVEGDLQQELGKQELGQSGELGQSSVASDIFDPLFGLSSLSSADLNSVIMPLGGVLAECLRNSRRRKLSKLQIIKELIKSTSGKIRFT